MVKLFVVVGVNGEIGIGKESKITGTRKWQGHLSPITQVYIIGSQSQLLLRQLRPFFCLIHFPLLPLSPPITYPFPTNTIPFSLSFTTLHPLSKFSFDLKIIQSALLSLSWISPPTLREITTLLLYIEWGPICWQSPYNKT